MNNSLFDNNRPIGTMTLNGRLNNTGGLAPQLSLEGAQLNCNSRQQPPPNTNTNPLLPPMQQSFVPSNYGIPNIGDEQNYLVNEAQQYWLPIQPFTQRTAPPLELDKLPREFAKYCIEAGRELEVPPAQVFPVALSTFFCAIQGAFEIEVKRNYRERVSAFIIVSIVSGGKKTPTYKFCIKALEEWIRNTPESKLALIDDVTPESFATALSEGPVGLMMDEGARFEQLISNHKKNDILFKGLGGTPITIRRETKENIVVERPVANALIMLQPERLHNIATKYNSKEYGVMGRALLVGIEPIHTQLFDDFEMSAESEAWYEKTVVRLAKLGQGAAEGSYEIGKIELSQEAKDTWQAVSIMWSLEKENGKSLEDFKEWAAKAPSHLLSIAGLLHTIKNEDPLSQPISPETMSQGTYVMGFFINHMLSLYDEIGTKPDVQCAKAILEKIKQTNVNMFPKVNLTTSMQGRYKAADIRQALSILQSRNYIGIVPNQRSGKAGRPHSDIIHVNPSFWSQW